jgi:SET domain-containing protein
MHAQVHGKGVFALRGFKKGERILLLTGKYIPFGARTKLQDYRYSFCINKNAHTDGLRMLRNKECNMGKFVNCPGRTRRLPNCTVKLYTFKFLIFLVALKPIKKGQELLCNYSLPPN